MKHVSLHELELFVRKFLNSSNCGIIIITLMIEQKSALFFNLFYHSK